MVNFKWLNVANSRNSSVNQLLCRIVLINIECLLFLLLGVMKKDGAICWFTNCNALSVLHLPDQSEQSSLMQRRG